MRHLIIVAHPNSDSFTMSLAGAYGDELSKIGHSVQVADLYRIGFDPVLGAKELKIQSAGSPACPDVVQAQNDIRAADVLSVIYPLWWLSMPAILKGYIDRVFARGFAYDASGGMVRGLLREKRAILVTVSGAPLQVLVKNGRWKALEELQDTHIFRSVGFELLEHLHFDEIAPGLSPALAQQHLLRIRSCARQYFGQI